jgi:hypothetical protein
VQRHEPIFEIPIHYHARSNADGKKLTARDGFRVLGTLICCRVQRPQQRSQIGF